MSIEALIQAHTEALLANTEAVKLLTLSLAGRTPTKSEKKNAEVIDVVVKEITKQEPGVVELLKEKQKERSSDVKTSDIDLKHELPITVEGEPVPYETVRALVLKLAPTQRDAIKALNAKHGIANLKVLLDKEDDFSTVNDPVKLEAVYADLQALEG